MNESILLTLAIIFVGAKIGGILASKIHAPQVVGEILAGLILGPSVLGLISNSEGLSILSEIGVILIMFFAGLETNLKDLKKTGLKATIIALCGVFVPLVLGWLLYSLFYGFAPYGDVEFFEALFIGVILTATSVSITVATLQELGKLKDEVGTTIVSAAIIDDVIGMIVLTIVLSLASGTGDIAGVFIKTGLFFVFAVGVGIIFYQVFKILDKRHKHTRRIPIFGVALCFVFAYVSEEYFGIADITGAYIAGVILCSLEDSEYIARRVEINSYLMFSPIFFASIGIKTTISGMDLNFLLFCICFVLVALGAKIIGCGTAAKCLGYNGRDSIKIGLGMMTRGEVALIIAQKGLDLGIISSQFFTPVILLIIASSIATPLLLRQAYKEKTA